MSADKSPVAVVGIGASAGGIEALSRFFVAMPADSGGAFVVVLHLDPTRESAMAHVLGNYTKMPVIEADKGMRLAADHVYVIAPDRYLTVRDGMLDLEEPVEPRGHRHPVDALFTSLAADQRERAVAIVLSGTGTNGTQGLKAIKAEGGLMLVQKPGTAKFDGMPRSAIAADMADHILAPEAMPEVLLRYLRHGYIAAASGEDSEQPNHELVNQVLKVLDARGHDFAGYKGSTLRRRIHRRVSLRNITAIDQYVEELRTNPDELTALAKDLMISVSGFFRDPAAWKTLAEQALGPLLNSREADSALRMWVPGCATGEEAYSLAILASELAEAADKRLELKVFATDAQDSNVNKARDGIFPAAATEQLGFERRRRFFDTLDGSYQVKRELRALVTFAPQNLMRDSPFSRMDLFSCRNLLIYLEPDAQERVLALCHFALHEGGYLFLGNAETVGRRDDLFEPVSTKWRIYRRLGPTRHDIIDFPLSRGPTKPRKEPDARRPVSGRDEPSIPAADAARRTLLERYAPASVLIDQRFRVLYFHGPTSDYLEQPTGEPTRDLLSMAREGLAGRLRMAVREALAEKRDVVTNAVVGAGKAARPVIIRVMPLARAKQGGSVLVSFEQPEPDAGSESTVTTDERTETGEATSGERALQEELNAVRAELSSTVEHMETANEELKASNEEVTSMNEELQSTNEELETSKEELQSFNEELHTVNNQLQHKVRELEDKTNDLDNLLAGTETATLFLDTNLCIKWFLPRPRSCSASCRRMSVTHLCRKHRQRGAPTASNPQW